MEESTEIKVEGETLDGHQNDKLIDVKTETADLSSQKTDISAVKTEDDQINLKCEPTLQNNLIEDTEDISSEDEAEDDDLEDISDDDEDTNFLEETSISKHNPSTSSSLNHHSQSNDDLVNPVITPLTHGYYNPISKNEDDLKYLIETLKENPKTNVCSYCWRIGHFKNKCNDKLWYGDEMNQNCRVWMEGCSKRKQVCLEMTPEIVEMEIERIKNKEEFEVVEELESSDEEEEVELAVNLEGSVNTPTHLRVNLILKNEKDLDTLKRGLKEENFQFGNPPTCNYCYRWGHIFKNCEDKGIRPAIKFCPIWKQGLEKRKQAFLELNEGATERIRERKRLANQRRKAGKKVKRLKRREIEEQVKREKLEDEEKRRKIEAAEMLLEIVNELLE